MSANRLLKILVLCLALVNVAMAVQTPAQIEKDIGNKVYCLCGCVTSLNTCPHPNCEVKDEMLRIIRADLRQGKAEPAILQDLVDRYGEKVLAAPPAHGFNLAAWILPGIGLLIGLFLAIVIVRKWRMPAAQAAAPAGAPPVDENLRNAVEEEMKKYVE
jgi:cytochrome c-type biogenesis protein CcmH